MTGRPPLPLGTWGQVRRYKVSAGRWRAVAQYRDLDGRTRQVERHSPAGRDDDTGARAERALLEHLRDRAKSSSGTGLTSHTTVEQLVNVWVEKFAERADRKPSTKAAYRYAAEKYVNVGIGGVRLGELTVEFADRFLVTISKTHGPRIRAACSSRPGRRAGNRSTVRCDCFKSSARYRPNHRQGEGC